MNSTPWNEHPLRANYERHDEATVESIFALASSLQAYNLIVNIILMHSAFASDMSCGQK